MTDHASRKGIGYQVWLHRYAVLTTAVTFPLIFVGGLVTSHDAALAVPDWPTTYGYNMFFFPWKKMVGGIFYEHSHRLIASAVGFLTIGLAIALQVCDDRKWLRRLGWIALALVIFQGVLGGMRVVMLKKEIAIFHACIAQLFFCLAAAIAFFTSRWWMERSNEIPRSVGLSVYRLAVGFCCLIFFQLILGATMRHTNSGLAIPDFPLMYGKVVPPMDASTLERVNEMRVWKLGLEPVTFFQLGVHLFHRVGAVLIGLGTLYLVCMIWRQCSDIPTLKKWGIVLLVLFVIQFGFGMSVIWTSKAADIATAHVAVGALTFMVSVLIALTCYKLLAVEEKSVLMDVSPGEGVAA
jgi:heme a synthase